MAEKNIFEQIAAGIPKRIGNTDLMASREYFRRAAQKITNISVRRLFAENAQDMQRFINTESIGSMYMMYYDPKWKKKLPYYDIFPLFFVVEIYADGFLGINLHYLPPGLRAKLMNALYHTAVTKVEKGPKNTVKEMTQLQINYQLLKNASRYKLFKPCLHRYLTDHVQSDYFFVPPDKWDMALMLPTAKFVKASEEQVWRDSKRMID